MDADLKARLERMPGAWTALDTPSELLVALRDGGGVLFSRISATLRPGRTVLAGDLGEVQPSELLNFLHQARRTGVLFTRSGGIDRALVMLDGNVAWACSTSPAENPNGPATPTGPALRQQVTEIFLALLVVRSGSFVFQFGVNRSGVPGAMSLDTQAMLFDGLRRMDEMELFRARIPTPDVKPQRTGKKIDGQVTPQAQTVLALADGARTVTELAYLTALGEFETTKVAYALIERGYLKV